MIGTEQYLPISESTDENVAKVNKEQLIRSVAAARNFNETFTNLYNKLENILQRQNMVVHHLTDANQLFKALQSYKKAKPEDTAELEQVTQTEENITENIEDKREKLAELKKKLKEVNKRFHNSRGAGDSTNNHLHKKELWNQIDELEAEIKGSKENISESTINTSKMSQLPNPVLPTGTEIYLEGFKNKNTLITEDKAALPKESKPKEKFEELGKNKAGKDNKHPFIPRSGPESDGNGFKAGKIAHGAKGEDEIKTPDEFSQGTEKYLPDADEIPGPGPKTDHEDDSAENVNGFTDFNTKSAVNPDKAVRPKLNITKKKLVNESRYTRAASTNEQEEAISEIERCLKKLGKNIVGGTTIGKSPQTVVLDLSYQDGAIHVNSGGWEDEYGVTVNGQKCHSIHEFRDAIQGKQIVNKIDTENENLEEEICPFCGADSVENGSCIKCGKQVTEESKKTQTTRLNNYNNTLMAKIIKETNTKSEFDRLCEDVLGPEEVELGIDEPTPEGSEADIDIKTGEEGECAECSPADKIRNAISELEAVLAELEGTGEIEDGVPSEGDLPVDGGEDLTGDTVKESALDGDNSGKLTSQKETGATSVKGRANVVSGDASDTISGEGDGSIENKDRSGKLEKFTTKTDNAPSKNTYKVDSKIKGKGQKFFGVK